MFQHLGPLNVHVLVYGALYNLAHYMFKCVTITTLNCLGSLVSFIFLSYLMIFIFVIMPFKDILIGYMNKKVGINCLVESC